MIYVCDDGFHSVNESKTFYYNVIMRFIMILMKAFVVNVDTYLVCFMSTS